MCWLNLFLYVGPLAWQIINSWSLDIWSLAAIYLATYALDGLENVYVNKSIKIINSNVLKYFSYL
jgi:hypothetical protein